MDKTVRLWHVTMDGTCLRVFKHSDFVTAIDFHPLDDKVFLRCAVGWVWWGVGGGAVCCVLRTGRLILDLLPNPPTPQTPLTLPHYPQRLHRRQGSPVEHPRAARGLLAGRARNGDGGDLLPGWVGALGG